MSSHFCKLFFFGKLFQLEVPFGVLSTKRVDSKSATFSCLGAEEVHSFIANWHSVPMLKKQEMIYHQSIYPCVLSLNLLDCKEDKNWWWSRRLKNAMSLHCPKRIPSIVLRKHLPHSPKTNRIPLKIEDTPLTAHSANS